MRVGIIDLGTNSVRFDIHEFQFRAKKITGLVNIHSEKVMVRLGQGVFSTGKLNKEAVGRTLESFVGFSVLLKEFHVERIVAFGTSALREARDSAQFIQLVKKKTGIEIKIITGYEEARLISLGILQWEKKKPSGAFALVDIGGGSTEIAICRGKKVQQMVSLPLGTARLQQLFLKGSPPSPLMVGGHRRDAVNELCAYIQSVLQAHFKGVKLSHIIGSSGTIKAIVRMQPKVAGLRKGYRETRRLGDLVELLRPLTTAQLLNVKGLESRRADMILGGAVLFREITQVLRAKTFSVSKYSLRDGILIEELELQAKQKTSIGLHFDHLLWRAERLAKNPNHLRQVRFLAETLFDELRFAHRLPRRWRDYLSAAAILHDVGESISPMNHEEHSYYVVKSANFPSMEDWESEFIGLICRYHNSGWEKFRKLPWSRHPVLRGERKKVFLKLLGMLQLADALDRSRRSLVTGLRAEKKRGQILLRVRCKAVADLESFRFEQKKEVFEKVTAFPLKMIIHPAR